MEELHRKKIIRFHLSRKSLDNNHWNGHKNSHLETEILIVQDWENNERQIVKRVRHEIVNKGKMKLSEHLNDAMRTGNENVGRKKNVEQENLKWPKEDHGIDDGLTKGRRKTYGMDQYYFFIIKNVFIQITLPHISPTLRRGILTSNHWGHQITVYAKCLAVCCFPRKKCFLSII